MILDLNALLRAGKTQESFFFEYKSDAEVTIPGVSVADPVKITGEIFVRDRNSAEIEGEITFTLVGDCTRCLTTTSKTFVVEFNEECVEDGAIPVTNGRIDLSAFIDEIIIINTPLTFLCKEDCKGLCQSCGANLNEEECKCNNK